MSLDDYISRLKFFNEKAAKLRRLSFTQSIYSQNPQARISFLVEQSTMETEAIIPHEESIDAFLFTFRFFMLGNEETSFRKMAELYEQLPIAEEIKEKLRRVRTNFNNWLDSDSPICFDGALTNRHIMNTFINGGLGHANDRNAVREYRKWEASPTIDILRVEFVYILVKIFETISFFRSVHEVILEELERPT